MALNRAFPWMWLLVALVTGCATDPPSAGPVTASEAVKIAQTMVGKPYRYGGSSPKGFDCSGLVHYSFSRVGLAVPRETGALFTQSLRVDPSRLRAGDLLFFRIEHKVSHVAIYVGEERFVHAPSSGKSVAYGTLSNPYWKQRLVKAGRL